MEEQEGRRIAIITGASGGIGREFTKLMLMENVDEIWAIARNPSRLAALKEEYGDKVIEIVKDLSEPEEVHSIERILQEKKPIIDFLINNAGVARMGACEEFSVEETEAIPAL